MKGEEMWNAHVDSKLCIRREVLRGKTAPRRTKMDSKKKKKVSSLKLRYTR